MWGFVYFNTGQLDLRYVTILITRKRRTIDPSAIPLQAESTRIQYHQTPRTKIKLTEDKPPKSDSSSREASTKTNMPICYMSSRGLNLIVWTKLAWLFCSTTLKVRWFRKCCTIGSFYQNFCYKLLESPVATLGCLLDLTNPACLNIHFYSGGISRKSTKVNFSGYCGRCRLRRLMEC